MINVFIRHTTLFFACTCCVSAAIAQPPLVISDGPSHSSASAPSVSPKIIISDGPAGAVKSGLQIVTTDGPPVLPYQYPPKIVCVTNRGPSQLPYEYDSGKVVVSDGPGTAKALPDPETSTLAPPLAVSAQTRTPLTAVSGGPVFGTPATSVKEPFYVYSDRRNSGNHFVPSGWMGDYQDLHLDENSHDHPHSGSTCIRIAYTAKGSQGNGWTGIYWQSPANNWGDKAGGYDLTGKRHLTFWARGEKGGEVISEFKIGGITGENGDSTSASTGSIALDRQWEKYTISLGGLDLTHVIGGFGWSANRDANPKGIVFYLDDIRYE